MIYLPILIVYFDFPSKFTSKDFSSKRLFISKSFSYPSIIQIVLFIMRELLIASRHRFERINKSKQISQQTGKIFYSFF